MVMHIMSRRAFLCQSSPLAPLSTCLVSSFHSSRASSSCLTSSSLSLSTPSSFAAQSSPFSSSSTTSSLITIKSTQRKYPIDIDLTRQLVSTILQLLKVPHMSVHLLFCSDHKMRELNRNLRQKSKSTDILSYNLPIGSVDPVSGVVGSPNYLGTMIACPGYIHRQMIADQEAHEYGELDLSEDAGVSRAMATVFSVQERIPYLLVHGLIHLVGFDHETEEEWEEMTNKEEEVLSKLASSFPNISSCKL